MDAHDALEHINMNGGRVVSSILGMDFDSYDGENDQLIAHHHDTNSFFEIDSKSLRANYVRSCIRFFQVLF